MQEFISKNDLKEYFITGYFNIYEQCYEINNKSYLKIFRILHLRLMSHN